MGTAATRTRFAIPTGLALLLWLPIVATTAVVIRNSLPYFVAPAAQDFWLERPELSGGTAWRVAFLLHVAGGVVCLAAALGQFSSTVLRRSTAAHRIAGRVYGVAVLCLLVPSGLFLATTAKGGLSGCAAFGLLAVWTGLTTWWGIRAAWERRIPDHRAWMIRSYAMVATALSFRLIYVALFAWQVEAHYVRAIWLSFIVNVLIAEWFVTRPRTKPNHPKRGDQYESLDRRRRRHAT